MEKTIKIKSEKWSHSEQVKMDKPEKMKIDKIYILIFLHLIKIPIPVTRSWRDLIELRFLVVHIIILYFSYLDQDSYSPEIGEI